MPHEKPGIFTRLADAVRDALKKTPPCKVDSSARFPTWWTRW